MAGIYNLGLIQDYLLPDDFSMGDIVMMWGCMLENIDPSNLDITKIVAKSLSQLSSTSRVFFDDHDKQVWIMDRVFTLLKIENDEIREYTLQALIEIAQ